MATSKNPKIQQLMAEIEALDNDDPDLIGKLNQIAEAVAAAQGKVVPKPSNVAGAPVDPADAFACEGCQ